MQTLNPFKRGDAFYFALDITDSAGEPVDVDVEDMICQFRDNNDILIAEMTITASETLGRYEFEYEDTTANFPITQLVGDVEMQIDGKTHSTEDISVTVLKDRSQPIPIEGG
jgi:hypothetical protein